MSRMNMEDNKHYDPVLVNGVKFGVMFQTLAGPITLDRDMPTMLVLDPGGATRVVTLPAAEKGLTFLIVNGADALEDLTINNPAAVTRGTISQTETAWVFCDGTSWYVGVMTTT